MKQPNLKLIPSKPEDVDKAVKYIYSSGPAAFEYVFQNANVKAKDILRYAFIREGGEFSYDNHYSLFYNDELVGIGSAFDAKKSSQFTTADALKILKYYRLNSIPIMMRGLKIEKIIKFPKSGEVALAHLGIESELRGKGLGTFLIKELMNLYDNEQVTFVLDVSEENPKAQSLYEKLGFRITSKNESNLKNKYSYVANHYRMEYTP